MWSALYMHAYSYQPVWEGRLGNPVNRNGNQWMRKWLWILGGCLFFQCPGKWGKRYVSLFHCCEYVFQVVWASLSDCNWIHLFTFCSRIERTLMGTKMCLGRKDDLLRLFECNEGSIGWHAEGMPRSECPFELANAMDWRQLKMYVYRVNTIINKFFRLLIVRSYVHYF